MPSKTDKIAAVLEELLKKRGTQKPTDRLGLERPVLSRDFENKPMAGWEKAAALMGAAVSPASTIASMVLAPPQEETLFDRQVIGPDGKPTILPKTSESVVPRMKKVQRRAQETIKKYPTKDDYVANAGSDTYSRLAAHLGDKVPRQAALKKETFDGTTYKKDPLGSNMDVIEYRKGSPVGRITFDEAGRVNNSGVVSEYQGQGIGKELYKKAAMLGRNIRDLGSTSQNAARARYEALKELAEGKFPNKSVKDSAVPGAQPPVKKAAAPSSGGAVRPFTDWNRMKYLQELGSLQDAVSSGEITPAGYYRARQILDSGPYSEVAKKVRENARSAEVFDLLDFTPK